MPVATDGLPVALMPAQINPFAAEICGDDYDENCDGNADEACVDKDGDHDVRGHDCDDNDPKRHHPTDIDPFPDPPNCCGYSLGKLGAPMSTRDFAGDATCARRSAAATASTRAAAPSTTARPTTPPASSTRTATASRRRSTARSFDCDDNDPGVHPGAVEACGSTKDLNCNGTVGEGCVPCDLDGDGFERNDPANNCPDANNKHPGMVDCNDDDAGVFPGATSVAGGTEGGVSVGKVAAALRGMCRAHVRGQGADRHGQDQRVRRARR